MATLALQFAGQRLGSFIGGPLGAIAGRAIGGLAGNVLDQALLTRHGPARTVEGPRLTDLNVQHSSEGSPIPKLYGRARLSGQVIWATQFEEEIQTSTTKSRSKIGPSRVTGKTVTYSYYANFAVGLCEGKISRVGRIWADGKLLDPAGLAYRVYRGSEDQLPDPLISSREGSINTPAYRGLAYVVFDRMPIERFGNRIPQLTFEVFRALDDLENRIKAVTMIPGATEFGYQTAEVKRITGPGSVAAENRHSGQGGTDWSVSLDQLAAACPNVGSIALVVSWFGSDLRCGQCEIAPAVDSQTKQTDIDTWRVSDAFRPTARLVSQVEGRSAFGGTPSDSSVIAAITDLRTRGKKIVFYPFVMMDIPAANGLTDPYTGAAGQPPYPWRGQITCDPAPGQIGSPDKTAAATTQIDAFFGSAAVSDFTATGQTVIYSGPNEWSYRRMLLHYAHLCALAGGVDTFLIGSELRNLVQVRDSASHYPVVDHLISLAGDVRQILGSASKISYAADWSEYFGHHPQDGSGDVYFHLDPLWSDGNIDFVGIDNYMPLSDWRAGGGHLDKLAGHKSIYDLDYLRGNIAGGEGFDWYYASTNDRQNQIRTPITDGAYGKPWVFRYKDLKNWWGNAHYDRPGGVESPVPTSWGPQSKPIRFTETGCPAADKGTNQPNVFLDAKSSSSFLPYFSTGARDDLIQRQFLNALTTYWTPSDPAYGAGNNPVSNVYGEEMVAHDAIHIWTWDARPFPHFPQLGSIWADGPNWSRGHWITGRMGSAPLNKLVAAILEDYGFSDHVTGRLYGIADGYVIDRAMSARQALEPLGMAYFFDAVESGDKMTFAHRDGDAVATVAEHDLVDADNRDLISLTRAQETELPVAVQLTYMDSVADYRMAAVESRRLVGLSRREARADLPIVLPFERVQQIADIWLQDVWAGREAGQFRLPPSLLAVEPGDNLTLTRDGAAQGLRITEISLGEALTVEARSIEPGVYTPGLTFERASEPQTGPLFGTPDVAFLDLPHLDGDSARPGMRVAAFAKPWPGGLAIYRSPSGSGFDFLQLVEAPATMGRTLTTLSPGPVSRWDRVNTFQVRLDSGTLSSKTSDLVLAGQNLAAVGADGGPWEVIQFADAVLIADDTYEISTLLRGQAGSEWAMAAQLAAGARFVLLDGAVDILDIGLEAAGLPVTTRTGPFQFDPGHAGFDERVVTVGDAGLRPLSPVHVRAVPDNGDVHISFIRRTRVDGDNWAPVEIPLGEAREHYEIDIYDGAAVVRTISSDIPQAIYLQADRIADGLSVPGPLTFSVSQMSETVGRGYPRTVTVQI